MVRVSLDGLWVVSLMVNDSVNINSAVTIKWWGQSHGSSLFTVSLAVSSWKVMRTSWQDSFIDASCHSTLRANPWAMSGMVCCWTDLGFFSGTPNHGQQMGMPRVLIFQTDIRLLDWAKAYFYGLDGWGGILIIVPLAAIKRLRIGGVICEYPLTHRAFPPDKMPLVSIWTVKYWRALHWFYGSFAFKSNWSFTLI